MLLREIPDPGGEREGAAKTITVRHPGVDRQLTSDSRVDHRERGSIYLRDPCTLIEIQVDGTQNEEKEKTCENLCIHSCNIWTNTIQRQPTRAPADRRKPRKSSRSSGSSGLGELELGLLLLPLLDSLPLLLQLVLLRSSRERVA